MPSLAAIVLAGGRSSRMGTDKAALEWHGRPLIAHVAAILADLAGDGPLVVAGPHQPPAWASGLPSHAQLLTDPAPDQGPVVGLRQALESLRGRAGLALVAATDQPWLSEATFAPLLAAIDNAPAAAWRDQHGIPQPLGAVYRVDHEIPKDAKALRDLLTDARILDADPVTAATLESLNTPAAYRRAVRRA